MFSFDDLGISKLQFWTKKLKFSTVFFSFIIFANHQNPGSEFGTGSVSGSTSNTGFGSRPKTLSQQGTSPSVPCTWVSWAGCSIFRTWGDHEVRQTLGRQFQQGTSSSAPCTWVSWAGCSSLLYLEDDLNKELLHLFLVHGFLEQDVPYYCTWGDREVRQTLGRRSQQGTSPSAPCTWVSWAGCLPLFRSCGERRPSGWAMYPASVRSIPFKNDLFITLTAKSFLWYGFKLAGGWRLGAVFRERTQGPNKKPWNFKLN